MKQNTAAKPTAADQFEVAINRIEVAPGRLAVGDVDQLAVSIRRWGGCSSRSC